jgi:hypothetical protein
VIQMTDDRGQMTEDRELKTVGRGHGAGGARIWDFGLQILDF